MLPRGAPHKLQFCEDGRFFRPAEVHGLRFDHDLGSGTPTAPASQLISNPRSDSPIDPRMLAIRIGGNNGKPRV